MTHIIMKLDCDQLPQSCVCSHAQTRVFGRRPPNMRGGAVNIHNVTSTRVLVLMNMLTIDDLKVYLLFEYFGCNFICIFLFVLHMANGIARCININWHSI